MQTQYFSSSVCRRSKKARQDIMKKVIGELARYEIEALYTQDNDLSRSDTVYKCLVDIIRLMNKQKDVEKPHEDGDDDDDEED